MKILLIPNTHKDKDLKYTFKIIDILKKNNIEIYMNTIMYDIIKDDGYIKFFDIDFVINIIDVVICIGGDGTIIHTCKKVSMYNKPVLGINAGRLGFLANLESKDIYKIEKIFNKDYKIDKRMTLDLIYINGDNKKKYTAVNDIVISKGSLSRIIDLKVLCMDKSIGIYRADGIIFSTPTGSTAYSLSAGGPIVESSINCIIMTPICPHSLFFRPLIFSEDKILKVLPTVSCNDEVYITIDGEEGFKFSHDSEIVISKGCIDIELIDISNNSFFDVINEKFIRRFIC